MVIDVLSVVVLLGSGLTAGVLFAVALSVLPALFAMPTDRYIYSHKLIGRNWDPTMPILVMSTTVVDLVLGFAADEPTAKGMFFTAAVLLAVSSYVSHFRNVPINRVVKVTDPENIPADWSDPRPLWRRWHTLRTSLALVALLVNAAAVTLV